MKKILALVFGFGIISNLPAPFDGFTSEELNFNTDNAQELKNRMSTFLEKEKIIVGQMLKNVNDSNSRDELIKYSDKLDAALGKLDDIGPYRSTDSARTAVDGIAKNLFQDVDDQVLTRIKTQRESSLSETRSRRSGASSVRTAVGSSYAPSVPDSLRLPSVVSGRRVSSPASTVSSWGFGRRSQSGSAQSESLPALSIATQTPRSSVGSESSMPSVYSRASAGSVGSKSSLDRLNASERAAFEQAKAAKEANKKRTKELGRPKRTISTF